MIDKTCRQVDGYFCILNFFYVHVQASYTIFNNANGAKTHSISIRSDSNAKINNPSLSPQIKEKIPPDNFKYSLQLKHFSNNI